MIPNFKRWVVDKYPETLKEGSNPGSKTGLYALSYGGIGLYPPAWYLTRSADAIFYLSIDERIYKGDDAGSFDISKIPGSTPQNLNSGEGGVWSISHLEGRPTHATQKNYAARNGERGPWDITHIKGKSTCQKNNDFVPDPGDGGMWKISHLPS